MTAIDVTGELSEEAARAATYRFVCLVALSRLNAQSLADAYESLADIYAWQVTRAEQPPRQLPERKHVILNPVRVTHTTRKPFSFDEE